MWPQERESRAALGLAQHEAWVPISGCQQSVESHLVWTWKGNPELRRARTRVLALGRGMAGHWEELSAGLRTELPTGLS